MIGIGGRGLALRHGGLTLAGGGFSLPFSDTFTRADGVLGAPWLGGSTWQIVSGKAVNTPTLGAELVVNGNFAAWTADNPNGWTITGESAPTDEFSEVGTGESHGGSGTGKLNVFRTSLAMYASQLVLTVGQWYRAAITINAVLGGNVLVRDEGSGLWRETGVVATHALAGRALNTKFQITSRTNGSDVTVDDVSAKALTLATLFNAVNAGTSNVDVSAAATIVASTQAGVVVNLDSLSSPANFVIGYHDGTAIKMEKAVNGVYTTLVNVTVAYSAGAAVRIKKNGQTYQVFYGGVQQGTDQTVSDATVISNQLHGVFSTHDGNSLDDFSVSAV